MTEEEQVIAENNYKILNYYIYKKNLKPVEEWLEYLSVPYIVAIMKYTDCTDIQSEQLFFMHWIVHELITTERLIVERENQKRDLVIMMNKIHIYLHQSLIKEL